MALINCEECGREISDKAAACPGCGAPVERPSAVKGTWKENWTEEALEQRLAKADEDSRNARSGCFGFLVLILLVFILFALLQ